jgi:hypothetical protein
VGAAGDRLGRQPSQRYSDRIGGGLGAAEVDEEAQIVVDARAAPTLAVGGGDVVCGPLPLALGV